MANLSTTYMGLKLRNPLIASSSGLTNSVESIKELEKNGIGAVVLKSLFEEEIMMELKQNQADAMRKGNIYPEVYDHFDYDTVEDTVTKYLNMIKTAKSEVNIPLIASVNCVTSSEWIDFAKKFEEAGADGLELNLFILPSDLDHTSEENEKVYFDVVEKVKKEVSIPVSLKISYYFSNLASMVQRLSETGVDSIVMFNRFYSPDFDIENLTVQSTNVLSQPQEISMPLRWIAIMAERAKCELSASTGVHDGASAIKLLLAGAQTTQVATAFYKYGFKHLETMLEDMEKWMRKWGFDTVDEFRGKMSQKRSLNPAAFERVQFMKFFSGK
jgi:dihydroorotate dehydrogenase (fumarate)